MQSPLLSLQILLLAAQSIFLTVAEPTYTSEIPILVDEYGHLEDRYTHVYKDFDHRIEQANIYQKLALDGVTEFEHYQYNPCAVVPSLEIPHNVGEFDLTDEKGETPIIDTAVIDNHLVLLYDDMELAIVEMIETLDGEVLTPGTDETEYDGSKIELVFDVLQIIEAPAGSDSGTWAKMFIDSEGEFGQIFTAGGVYEYLIDGDVTTYSSQVGTGGIDFLTWKKIVVRDNNIYVLGNEDETKIYKYQLTLNMPPQVEHVFDLGEQILDFDLFEETLMGITFEENVTRIYEISGTVLTMKFEDSEYHNSQIVVEENMFAILAHDEESGNYTLREYMKTLPDAYDYFYNRNVSFQTNDDAYIQSDDQYIYLNYDTLDDVIVHTIPKEVRKDLYTWELVVRTSENETSVHYLDSVHYDGKTPFVIGHNKYWIRINMITKQLPFFYCRPDDIQQSNSPEGIIMTLRFLSTECEEKTLADDTSLVNYCQISQIIEIQETDRSESGEDDSLIEGSGGGSGSGNKNLLWLLAIPVVAVLAVAIIFLLRKLKKSQRRSEGMKNQFRQLRDEFDKASRTSNDPRVQQLNNQFVELDSKLEEDQSDFFDKEPVKIDDIQLQENKMSAKQEKQIQDLELDD